MSRLGVIKWIHLHETLNTTISNKTIMRSLQNQMDKDEIIHFDLFITFAIIGALAIHSSLHQSNKSVISGMFALFCLIVTTIFAPIVGTVLIICACYRQIAIIIISRTCKKGTFAGLMDGADAFWSMEDKMSLSIINVLAMVDFSFIVNAMNNNEEPLQTVCDLIMDRLLCTPVPFPKLICYRRQSWLGYFYWEKPSAINIYEHVRFMDIKECNSTISERALKGYISSIVNLPLPKNNRSNWEILVGRCPVTSTSDPLDSMESGKWTPEYNNGYRYPVLFRIHHSLGDGLALVNLLMNTLSDPYTRSNTPVTNNLFNSHCTYQPDTQKLNTDVMSVYLDLPSENLSMTKNFMNNFYDCSNNFQQLYPQNLNMIKKLIRIASGKLAKFVAEIREKIKIYQQHNLQGVNIMLNARPNGIFLELLKNSNLTLENDSQYYSSEKIYFETLMQKINDEYYFLNMVNNVYKSLKNIAYHSSIILLAPACIFNQLIKRKDLNTLHGPSLSGYKVVAWHCEQEGNHKNTLLTKINQIRSKTGARFSDIILTALSSSLETFYKQRNDVPHDITVVIPAQLCPPVDSSTTFIKSKNRTTKVTKLFQDGAKKKLDNKFSVALLTLPIANDCFSKVALFSKLRQVRKQSDLLRNSPDYIINYWLLNLIATLIPTYLLRPILASTQCSVVLSNLPGPDKMVKLAGHTLHNLVFWVPNRETTGVGVTLLSYAGRLQLGIIADRALIPCQQDAQIILDDIISAIQEMDKISSPV